MTSNYRYYDTELEQYVDLDDYFITDAWIIDRYVGNGLWAWGYNGYGQLGLGDTTNRSFPVQVGILTNWKQVSIGSDHTTSIKTDGTLWVWGRSNIYGQLGLVDRINRSSPVQVGTLTNWKQVSAGGQHTVSIKTDGTLWAWGRNDFGQLGLNNRVNISLPIQVGALTNWKQVNGGQDFTTSIKTDGTLWTWGHNYFGQLGLGDRTHRSSPVQVGALTNWKLVSAGTYHTAAVKTDGTLWTWGFNYSGQLGLGNITHRSSPVQVGSLTNWKEVNGGRDFTTSIKTDGTLWAWGRNDFGQLGLGDTTNRSSPVQVGALTNWKLVECGSYKTTAAIKTDGTLWMWGNNGFGQLGLGISNANHRSSPVQIGTSTNWKQVIVNAHTVAVTYTEI